MVEPDRSGLPLESRHVRSRLPNDAQYHLRTSQSSSIQRSLTLLDPSTPRTRRRPKPRLPKSIPFIAPMEPYPTCQVWEQTARCFCSKWEREERELTAWSSQGILVAIGGATSTQYVDNSVLDVFDIGKGGWTKQATLGDTIGEFLWRLILNLDFAHPSCRLSSKPLRRSRERQGRRDPHPPNLQCVVVCFSPLCAPALTTLLQSLWRSKTQSDQPRLGSLHPYDPFVHLDLCWRLPSWAAIWSSWASVRVAGKPADRDGRPGFVGLDLRSAGAFSLSDAGMEPDPSLQGLYVYDVSKSAWQNSYTTGTTVRSRSPPSSCPSLLTPLDCSTRLLPSSPTSLAA